MGVVRLAGYVKNQYGFARGRNTTQALDRVKNFAEAKRGIYAALVAFDVRNAFNSLRWDLIHKELENRNASGYLKQIMKGYLSDRWVRLHLAEGSIEHRMEVGVPQGTVIGPTLWNLVYDRLLKRPVSPACEVIGYADDIALLVSGYRMNIYTGRLKGGI